MSDPAVDPIARHDALPAYDDVQVTAPAVLRRLVEGLAFRYRWATDDLSRDLLDYRPCEGAMDLGELLDHLRYLARWVHVNVRAARAGDAPVPYPACCDGLPDPARDPRVLREQTLTAWSALADDLAEMSADELAGVTLVGGREPTSFPFWHLLNGPLADALTHVGQVASWRRMAGHPAPRADVFRGRPPRA